MRFLSHPARSRPDAAPERTLRSIRAARSARLLGGLGLLLAATALPAQQAQYHEENGYLVREISGTLAGAAHFRVVTRSELGDIRVHGIPGPDLQYRIRIRSRAGSQAREMVDGFAVEVRRSGNTYEIHTEAPRLPGRAPWSNVDAQLDLGVPAGASSVSLQAAVGNIEVEDLNTPMLWVTDSAGSVSGDRLGGAVRIATASGNIELGRVAGRVSAHSAGGSVAVQDGGQAVEIASLGGNLNIGHAGGAVRAETAGGAITIGSADGDVVANTAGGNITLGRIAGQVRSQTAGGNIRIQAARSVRCATSGGNIELHDVDGAVRAETAAGAILADIIARAASFGASRLVSAAGAISISLPGNLPVTVRADIDAPGGHRLRSDFKELGSPYSEPDGERLSVEGQLNGGGPVLRLVSTSSDITIRRRP